MPRALRLVAITTILLALSAGLAVDASAALSKGRAVRAAHALAERVGLRLGAAEAYAGLCKRKSANSVVCWAAIVYGNKDAAAQRVRVTKRGGRVRAKRFGKIYEGNLRGRSRGGQSGGEWAVCGIRSSVCIGS